MVEQMTPDVEREAQDETDAGLLSDPGRPMPTPVQAQGSPQSAQSRPAR
jgi:hypothetical protein